MMDLQAYEFYGLERGRKRTDCKARFTGTFNLFGLENQLHNPTFPQIARRLMNLRSCYSFTAAFNLFGLEVSFTILLSRNSPSGLPYFMRKR